MELSEETKFNNDVYVSQREEMGKRLHEAIQKSKYTQEAFAEACGITYPTLRSYILGKYYYRVDVLLKASKLLDVSPEYLLCQKNEEVEPAKKFAQTTHLREKASLHFLSLIAKDSSSGYNEATHIIRALDNLIEDKELLEIIANFFWYARNNDVDWGSAEDKKEYEFAHQIGRGKELEIPRHEFFHKPHSDVTNDNG